MLKKPPLSNRNEIYFCIYATSNEHGIIEWDIDDFCRENGLTLKYYRELKQGHVPMFREVKIVGPGALQLTNTFLNKKPFPLIDSVVKNPHKVFCECGMNIDRPGKQQCIFCEGREWREKDEARKQAIIKELYG